MFTIDDVVKGLCTSEQVWSQFVTPGIEVKVLKHFTMQRLLESEDKFFHNISLAEWADFADSIKGDVLSSKDKQTLFTEHLSKDKTAPSRWKSTEDGICISKQAARQGLRRVLEGRGDIENLKKFSIMAWAPGDKL